MLKYVVKDLLVYYIEFEKKIKKEKEKAETESEREGGGSKRTIFKLLFYRNLRVFVKKRLYNENKQ